MVRDYPKAGEMNSLLTFYERTGSKSASGVSSTAKTALGQYAAQRMDVNPNVDFDGRNTDLSTVTFRMHFVQNLFTKGGRLLIEDFDGEYEIVGPIALMGGRQRYMTFKAKKRG